ncbi:PAS domain-containing sensor histidine kinase [Congregibacter variabilis]|uniref:histidine kinase n=1 Tax=Congregibacter variabilis TaxID=3081200 RepID=A0ABZ0I3X1_9GAMM|nr:PAS domain-containing sensor histidine kinase [Congregibacter sp. IMCC43200]
MDLLDRETLDAMPDAIVISDDHGKILLANHLAEQLFEYVEGSLTHKNVEALLPERFRNAHVHHRQTFLENRQVRRLGGGRALCGRARDGREFPLDISLRPISVDKKTLIISVLRDISKRTAMSENRFRAIFQQTHQLLGIVDLDGTLLDVNKMALRYSGLRYEDEIGLKYWKTNWWVHSEPLQQQLKRAIERAVTGDTVRFEATHPRPDGSHGNVEFSIRPVRCVDDQVDFLVAESHDVSAQKKAEQRANQTQAYADELRKAFGLAESATAAKTRFLAAASHDLRQPLQSLNLYLSVMDRHLEQEDHDTRQKLHEINSKMRQSVDSMSEVLDSLLNTSVIDHGMIAPHKSDFCLQEVMDRVLADNLQQAEQKSLRLSYSGGDCVVHSDPSLLTRIIENLVSNAINFTDVGEVSIECRYKDDLVEIVVRDSGIGIPDSKLCKIFDEYYQLEQPTSNRRKGNGLGLSIAKHIAQILEHPLSAESIPGQGSSFTLLVSSGRSLREAPSDPENADPMG